SRHLTSGAPCANTGADPAARMPASPVCLMNDRRSIQCSSLRYGVDRRRIVSAAISFGFFCAAPKPKRFLRRAPAGPLRILADNAPTYCARPSGGKLAYRVEERPGPARLALERLAESN